MICTCSYFPSFSNKFLFIHTCSYFLSFSHKRFFFNPHLFLFSVFLKQIFFSSTLVLIFRLSHKSFFIHTCSYFRFSHTSHKSFFFYPHLFLFSVILTQVLKISLSTWLFFTVVYWYFKKLFNTKLAYININLVSIWGLLLINSQ